MRAYILRRLAYAVPTILGAVTVVFFALHVLPGNVADQIVADFGMSAEDIERLNEQWGLNDPIPVQYARFIGNMAQGDLGRSIWSRREVTSQIAQQFPATLRLAIASTLISVGIGVPLGVIAALYKNRWGDTLSMAVSLIGVAMPNFWFGLILIMVFALSLGWFPTGGSSGVRTLILPAFTLGFSSAAVIARVVRSQMLEVMNSEFIVTARAKGLHSRQVVWRHALRNAMIPAVTVIGLQTAVLIDGAIIIETVFQRQGLGHMVASGVLERDFPVVQGVVIIGASAFVLINLLVDVLYGYLDPRIRYD